MRPLVPDRIRLWKAGVRERVMDLCCALHNFRVRLIPWQPMTEIGRNVNGMAVSPCTA